MIDLKGKCVGVVGYSRSGRAVARRVLLEGGHVRISDRSRDARLLEELKGLGWEHETGGNTESFLSSCDLIVLSPGVDGTKSPFRELKAKGIPLVSEIEFAYPRISGKIIGITGSNGKSTVTTLIHHLLTSAGRTAHLTGNIGFPLTDTLGEAREFWVVELSSFQLEETVDFHPWGSLLLNLTPDHLDRYPSVEEYIQAKLRIFQNQGSRDWAVLNRDDPRVLQEGMKVRAEKLLFSRVGEADASVSQGWVLWRGERVLPVAEIPLLGVHNLENVLASLAAGIACGLTLGEIRDGVRSFKGLEHRTEPCGEIEGRLFINDSKATNLDSTLKALESFDRPLMLILGGKDKGGEFSVLNSLLKSKARAVILLGAASDKIDGQIDPGVLRYRASSMAEAVRIGYRRGERGDVVLLAPGCASFDMYSNFEERGRDFKAQVSLLAEEVKNG